MTNRHTIKLIKSILFYLFLIYLFATSLYGYHYLSKNQNLIIYAHENIALYLLTTLITGIAIVSFFIFIDQIGELNPLKIIALTFSFALFPILFIGYQHFLIGIDHAHIFGMIAATLLLFFIFFEAHYADLKDNGGDDEI